MPENEQWPEPMHYAVQPGLGQRCAELSMLALINGGYQWIARHGNNEVVFHQSEPVVSSEFKIGDQYIEALRVKELMMARVSGDSPVLDGSESEEEYGVRVFALQRGTVDVNEVDPDEVDDEDYSWTSLALVALESTDPNEWTEENVTLLDARTGKVLNDSQMIHLTCLLEALNSNLSASGYANGVLIEELDPVKITPDVPFGEIFQPFEPGDYIRGNGCALCESGYTACIHNAKHQN